MILFKNLNLASILYENMYIYFIIIKRLALLLLNHNKGLNYLRKNIFWIMMFNATFNNISVIIISVSFIGFFFCTYIFSTYVKHIIIFIPLKLYTSFTGLTLAC